MLETKQRTDERRALLYGLCAVLAWSTVATGFKLGLAVLAVEQLLLLGTLVSWLVFLAAAAHKSGGFRLHGHERWRVCALGSLNPLAYYLILFAAYERLPAHLAQPINYTWAITLALLAVPILGQRLSGRTLAGIVISYTGVVVLLVTSQPGEDGTSWDVVGVALALASTVFWAAYWLLNARMQSPPVAVMFWSFSFALPLVALACWLGPGWPAIGPDAVIYGAWVGLLEMGMTFLLWQRALSLTASVARIGQLIFISPFVSLVLIYFVLGETFGAGAVAGLAVIVLGLWFSQRPTAST